MTRPAAPVAATDIAFSWLYDQKSLGLVPVHSQQGSFEYVQVSEMVEPEFVTAGTLVLTLGLSFENDVAGLKAYASKLAAAGATGIGFGIGVEFDDVPAPLIKGAKAAGLEVFAVPRAVSFQSIVHAVHAEQNRRLQQDYRALTRQQDQLNRAAIDGGIAQLLDVLAKDLRADVALADNDGRVVYQGEGLAKRLIITDLSQLPAGKGPSASSARWRALDDGDLVCEMTHVLGSQGERYHVLKLVREQGFSRSELSAITHCMGLADIVLQRPRTLRKARSELNSLALALLLGIEGGQRTLSQLISNATDAYGRVRPAVLYADDPEALAPALRVVDERLEQQSRALFSVPLDDNTVVVLFRGNRTHTNVRSYCSGPTFQRIRLAIGEPTLWSKLSMADIDLLRTAAQSAELGRSVAGEDVALQWLHNDTVRKLLTARADQTLGALREYDRINATELARTAEVYARSGFQLSDAADVLGVHRHTLRSRIDRINKVCGIDLSSPATQAELLIITLALGEG